MSGSKKRNPKTSSGISGRSTPVPQPVLPTLPIPDFDPVRFLQLCTDMETLAKESGKAFGTLLAICEEIKSRGVLEALSQGERTTAAVGLIQEMSTALPRCLAATEQWHTALDTWHAGERRSRRSRFEQLCQVMGWTIAGSWPEPVLNRNVFLSIDEQKDRATINGRTTSGKPTAERLALAVAEEIIGLQQNLTPPETFIAQVWKAYSARAASPQTGIQVLELIAELTWQRQSKSFQRDPRTELFHGYALAQFRADLTHYLASGAPPLSSGGKSYELQIVGGSFAQDGIYMYFPQTDRLATCGRLTFQPVASGTDK